MEKTNAFDEKMAWKDAYKRLQSYHKLSGSYFNEDSMIYLLTAINHGRNHRLVVTTHSPYILYALNNCLMAYTVKDEMPEDEYNELDCRGVALNPGDVAVWEIEDGVMRSDIHSVDGTIQDSSGLIRANYFNRIMQGIMGDFNNMLNYCEGND